jgi:hypothetical protein
LALEGKAGLLWHDLFVVVLQVLALTFIASVRGGIRKAVSCSGSFLNTVIGL